METHQNKSQSTSTEKKVNPENKNNTYSMNILYRKRANNSIDNIKRKRQ